MNIELKAGSKLGTMLEGVMSKGCVPFGEDDMIDYGKKMYKNRSKSEVKELCQWCIDNNVSVKQAQDVLAEKDDSKKQKKKFGILIFSMACNEEGWFDANNGEGA